MADSIPSTQPTEADEAPGGTWQARVAAAIGAVWAEQAFRREADRAAGLEELKQRRPDFTARADDVAALIMDAAPRLATANEQADAEYMALLRDPMWKLLTFLRPPVRAALARQLIADYARSPAVAEVA